ncbi:MAG: cyclase family protein, partial [Candidatus Jordarchaeaceae archaeon]
MGRLRFIDLSVPIEAVPSEFVLPEIVHEDHKKGAELMKLVFGAGDSDLPDGLGWANDTIKLQTHTGTHLDAPWHYFPTSEGKKSKTIDEIPLEWCFSDGVVLDMRHKPDGSVITVEDIKNALNKIKYKIKPLDIVLIMTGVDKYWGTPEYLNRGCGMGRESTIWLCDQGVKIMGTLLNKIFVADLSRRLFQVFG